MQEMSMLAPMKDYIGYCAGTLTTVAFLPQVLKVFRERSARDISLGMYLLFCTGVVAWLLYGLILVSWPIIIANIVTLLLSGTVLVMKIVHKRRVSR